MVENHANWMSSPQSTLKIMRGPLHKQFVQLCLT